MKRWMRRLGRSASQMLRTPDRLRSAAPTHRLEQTIGESGLFDAAWYRSQGAVESVPHQKLLAHYLRHGERADKSPHPLFDVAWYRRRLGSADRGVLVSYLEAGPERSEPTHPIIDVDHYLREFPDARDYRFGITGHFLESGHASGAQVNAWFNSDRYPESPDEPAVVNVLRRLPPPSLLSEPAAPSRRRLLKWISARRRRTQVAVGAVGDRPCGDVLVSVVVGPAQSPAWTERCVAAIWRSLADIETEVEVVVVERSGGSDSTFRLQMLAASWPATRVMSAPRGDPGHATALNLAIDESLGEFVIVVDPSLVVLPGWFDSLLDPLRTGIAAVTQPKILARPGWVVTTGYVLDGAAPIPALAGLAETDRLVETAGERVGPSGLCLAGHRSDLVAVGGFDPRFGDRYAGLDLGIRVGHHTGKPTIYVPESTVIQAVEPAATSDQAVESDEAAFRSTYPTLPSVIDGVDLTSAGLTGRSQSSDNSREASLIPVFSRSSDPERPLRWAIKIAPFDLEVRNWWGDWHYAMALRDALRELGHEAVVDLRHAWRRPTAHLDDVVVVLRGLEEYEPDPAQTNLLWIISHPDRVADEEIERYDRCVVASHVLADRLRPRLSTPVEVLLQCTDPRRFHPPVPTGTSESVDAPRHEVLFVGNSRSVARPIVLDAVNVGLPIAVYGKGWTGLIPEDVVKGAYLPNEVLGEAYRGSGVVLCDHWDDMRRDGLLSNRLFDAAACGVPVVSDHMPDILAVFGPSVRTYRHADELADIVNEALHDSDRTSLVEQAGRVIEHHSFGARAARLSEIATQIEKPHR